LINPEFCHHRIIAGTLTLAGYEVFHILDIEQSQKHCLLVEARRESIATDYDLTND